MAEQIDVKKMFEALNFYIFTLKYNEPLVIPKDYVLTSIARTPIGDQFSLKEQLNLENININIIVGERTFLFTPNIPLPAIPNPTYALKLPCVYFLPKGTQIKWLAQNSTLFEKAFKEEGGIKPTPELNDIKIVLYGYFVRTLIPNVNFRPSFFVFQFIPELENKTSTVIKGTVQITEQFLFNCLYYTSLEKEATTTTYNYVVSGYNNFIVKITYDVTSSFLSDTNERVDLVFRHRDFPLYLKKSLRVSPGASIVVEKSVPQGYDPSAPDTIYASYLVIGGQVISR